MILRLGLSGLIVRLDIMLGSLVLVCFFGCSCLGTQSVRSVGPSLQVASSFASSSFVFSGLSLLRSAMGGFGSGALDTCVNNSGFRGFW